MDRLIRRILKGGDEDMVKLVRVSPKTGRIYTRNARSLRNAKWLVAMERKTKKYHDFVYWVYVGNRPVLV